MHLAVAINLCHANVADLVMTIMDTETAVPVECAWEAKANGHVEVHYRLLDHLLTASFLLSFNSFLFHQCSSFGNILLSFV